jgi:AbrB family looped-hinge helix DNA binding protein
MNKEIPMNTLVTTRMSSKGQVVIPETIRKQLDLKAGTQFVVMGEDDVVILKAITAPGMDTFKALIKQAHQQAKLAGLKRADIANAVSKARGRK